MRIVSLCLALLIGCFNGIGAQQKESSLLWEINGNGLKQPSWIFGTYHIICKSDFEITPALEAKVKQASAVYLELKFDDPGMQVAMMKKIMMPDHSLDSLMGSDYEAVSKKFTEITGGMSLRLFNKMKPFAVLAVLEQGTMSDCPQLTPDVEIMKIGKTAGNEIHGLETIEEQMDAIDKSPLQEQVNDIRKMILGYDSIRLAAKDFVNVYKKKNIDSIYSFMKTKGELNSEFEKNLLLDRNRKWIPLIEKASAEGSVFYAVGAGHLGGPDGVVNLLRKRGYKLTPVKY